jgi:hypothetical protein
MRRPQRATKTTGKTISLRGACLRAASVALWLTTLACSGQSIDSLGGGDAGKDSANGSGASGSDGSANGAGSGADSASPTGTSTASGDAGCANDTCPLGSYLESCTGCTATTTELSCSGCAEGSGSSEGSSLPLPCSEDIANCFGELSCGPCPCQNASCPAGSYLQSCTGCSATSSQLQCAACKNSQGGSAASSLPLPCAEAIADCNGQLTCGSC